MSKRIRWAGLPIIVFLLLVAAHDVAWATCGTCQVCQRETNLSLARDFCRVASDENGAMCCSQDSIGPQTFCSESGTLCYGVVVGGGGGGGTGGGGGGSCGYQNGWCPAECWSCGGGVKN
jgi:hypothetical protein